MLYIPELTDTQVKYLLLGNRLKHIQNSFYKDSTVRLVLERGAADILKIPSF